MLVTTPLISLSCYPFVGHINVCGTVLWHCSIKGNCQSDEHDLADVMLEGWPLCHLGHHTQTAAPQILPLDEE